MLTTKRNSLMKYLLAAFFLFIFMLVLCHLLCCYRVSLNKDLFKTPFIFTRVRNYIRYIIWRSGCLVTRSQNVWQNSQFTRCEE